MHLHQAARSYERAKVEPMHETLVLHSKEAEPLMQGLKCHAFYDGSTP